MVESLRANSQENDHAGSRKAIGTLIATTRNGSSARCAGKVIRSDHEH